jgi:DNA adenine methylase
VNKRGNFNVPFGNNKRIIYDEKQLVQASRMLKNSVLKCCDFQELVKTAKAGDFVYLDPPYTVLHSNNGFKRYNEKLFSWADQVRLAETARDLAERGCLTVVSNADNQDVVDLYPGFVHLRLLRQSTLAADALRRRETQEILFVSLNDITNDLFCD